MKINNYKFIKLNKMSSFTYQEKVYTEFNEDVFYEVYYFIRYQIGCDLYLWSNETLVEIYKERYKSNDHIKKAYYICKNLLDFLYQITFEKDEKIIKFTTEMSDFVSEIEKKYKTNYKKNYFY